MHGPVVVISRDADRFDSFVHQHAEAQLVYAIGGVVAVTTAEGTWVVPPSRAVWVPPGIAHQTHSHATVQFRALLIDPAGLPHLPATCAVVAVSPLLRELILRLADLPRSAKGPEFRQALTRLLLLELSFVPTEPLGLPWPEHRALVQLCETIRHAPVHSISLAAAATVAHMSRSSFMRLFKKQTGMSFARWQQQARLLHALVLLAEGQSILNVALDCGYDSPSAFSAMFRRSLGRSPSAYFSQ
ncbi:AraC family transcriptional regulator [Rhodopseudomonas boonkerdii]|nr:AraC family transcriptional regulator [Rhodopseudomonas boonkerdii]